jgi:NhaP-type Na+/H+ or K+/H+ antiporter
MIDLECPDIILMQETMGQCGPIITKLQKMFKGWEFVGFDSFIFFWGGRGVLFRSLRRLSHSIIVLNSTLILTSIIVKRWILIWPF